MKEFNHLEVLEKVSNEHGLDIKFEVPTDLDIIGVSYKGSQYDVKMRRNLCKLALYILNKDIDKFKILDNIFFACIMNLSVNKRRRVSLTTFERVKE